MAPRRKGKSLTVVERRFALEYLANGLNGLAAYKASHPNAGKGTCGTNAHRLLKSAEVRAFIDAALKKREDKVRIDGEEALDLISAKARVDIRELFDEVGNLKPMGEWPPAASHCVKSVKRTKDGFVIQLYDKLRALELLAVAGGKLRQSVDHKHSFSHVDYLGKEPPPEDE